jgi:serine phosphatase RsbU (regulator of sigma subunit)
MRLTFLILIFISVAYSAQSDFDEKIAHADDIYYTYPDSSYKICMSIDTSKLSKSSQGKLSLSKARVSILMTDYEGSERELLNAEDVFIQLNDLPSLANTYALKSILLKRLGERHAGIAMLKKSYAINVELNDYASQASNMSNLSMDYIDIDEPDSAKLCLTTVTELKDYLGESQFYYLNQNWGKYYQYVQEYEVALTYFDKALNIAEELGMTDSKATILMLIGLNYEEMNDLPNAEKFAYMSYAFSEVNNLIYEKSEALEVMLHLTEKKGDFETALKFQKELMAVNDTIFNIEKLNKVKQVKSKLELAEKEKEIASEKAISAKKELENETIASRNNLLLISLAAVGLILISLVYAFIKNKKLYSIISSQKKVVDEKNMMISEALKDIDDSLTYSKFIQDALMPSNNKFDCFKDFFIMFKPKEKVSGDFYWLHQDGQDVYFCVADCTGHGVPGALVSVVGANALNSCVKEQHMSEPQLILDKLAEIVEYTLDSEERSMKDGMDICFCKLNLDTNKLTYAGANNPLYILNNSGLQILRPNKQPIGKYEHRKPFEQEEITLSAGDCLYLFSDGYADQFGGPKGKKFMYKKLRNILENVGQLDMSEQNKTLQEQFDNWKGNIEQVDDVCIIGVRV